METQTSTSRIWFDSAARIVYVEARAGSVFDVQEALENKEASLCLVGDGKKITLLFTSDGNITTTPAMRTLSASAEYNDNLYAVALLSTNSAMKILGNFYLRLSRPAVPTRFFSKKESAVEWLKTYAELAVSS
ncbi:MAG: hypothetical protein ACRC3B_03180 [Bacteroidia bacterium]